MSWPDCVDRERPVITVRHEPPFGTPPYMFMDGEYIPTVCVDRVVVIRLRDRRFIEVSISLYPFEGYFR
jgi:hypothetical protein